MFKADDYRMKIQGMRSALDEAGYSLDLENQRIRLEELKKEQMIGPAFFIALYFLFFVVFQIAVLADI